LRCARVIGKSPPAVGSFEALFQEIGAEKSPRTLPPKAQLYLGLRQHEEALRWALASLNRSRPREHARKQGTASGSWPRLIGSRRAKKPKAALEQATIITREAQDPTE
jgi:hypothetical protein